MRFNDTNQTAPLTIDIGQYLTGTDSMVIICYWVGIRTTALSSGYSVQIDCTDQLGSVSTHAPPFGDGSTQSAISGVVVMQHGDTAAFTFAMGYFDPLVFGLAYDYDIYVTPAPGAP